MAPVIRVHHPQKLSPTTTIQSSYSQPYTRLSFWSVYFLIIYLPRSCLFSSAKHYKTKGATRLASRRIKALIRWQLGTTAGTDSIWPRKEPIKSITPSLPRTTLKGSKSGCKSEHFSIDDINLFRMLNSSRFCELMNEDPLAFLQHCSKEDIMTFWK
jgi:hypothetical protein